MPNQSLAAHSREVTRERTRTKIKNAMLLLMSEKSVDSITITELARAAGVNRKTVYSHYASLDAILAELEDDFVRRMFSLFDRERLPDYFGTPQLLYRILIESFVENSHQLRLLILTGEHNRLLGKIRERILQLLGETMAELGSSGDWRIFLYRTEFISGGVMAVLERWAAEPGRPDFATVSPLLLETLEHIDTLF